MEKVTLATGYVLEDAVTVTCGLSVVPAGNICRLFEAPGTVTCEGELKVEVSGPKASVRVPVPILT